MPVLYFLGTLFVMVQENISGLRIKYPAEPRMEIRDWRLDTLHSQASVFVLKKSDGVPMFTNLLIITVLIIAFWMAATAFYLYTSRQQESLEKEIEAVQKLLDKSKP
jgi:hypothetical protein